MPAVPAHDLVDPRTTVARLSSQYPEGLIGVPAGTVRLTWAVDSGSAAGQTAYQLGWREAPGDWAEADAVAGSDSIGVPAPGGPVPAASAREYRVRVATPNGWSPWSAPVAVETALPAELLPDVGVGAASALAGPSPLLRTAFRLPAPAVRARLAVSSLGVHEVRINGTKVGAEHLAPGWTAYQERIVVATWDVTSALRVGENVLAGILSDGWYRGRLGWTDGAEHYGHKLALVARLDVDCEDGSVVSVTSGPGWRTATGEVRSSSLYDGTAIDFRAARPGWDTPGFDDASWDEATLVPVDRALFEPRLAHGVRTVAELPMHVERRGDVTRLDAGQNVAGWVRVTVRGRAGERVVVRHAEVLEPDGSLHTKALRSARATDEYLLAEDGEQVLEPAFTFHGFQYADLTGAEVVRADAVAISSATEPRGDFASSHPALDRLHSNVVWSQRDNFVSVPTDCPQRDERLGWTGDAQAFAATANTLFDVESFWLSWLRDLEIDQTDAGGVPAVVPNLLGDGDFVDDGSSSIMGRAGWADAATIVPWSVYESYGSDEVLRRQLESMRRWVAHLERRAGADGLLPTEFQFGDWLDPDAPGHEPWKAKVSGDYVADAFFVQSARILSRAEALVGDASRSADAAALAERVAAATWTRFSDHLIASQTGCALALQFGIAPVAERERVGAALAELVRGENGRIATGFLGTPLVLHALAETGHVDEAYLMLLRREAPSWLYQVDQGATTIWERWDALLPDGSIHPGDMGTGDGAQMLSFNHYAYGAVVDWMYRYVAGIAPTVDEPGYRRVVVAPRPAAEVTSARASVASRLGRVAIDWHLDTDGSLAIVLQLPFGSSATLDLPTSAESVVTVGGRRADATVLPAGHHEIRVTAPVVAAARAEVVGPA